MLNKLEIADQYDVVVMVPFVKELASPGICMVEKTGSGKWDCSCGVVLNPDYVEQAGPPVRQNGIQGNEIR